MHEGTMLAQVQNDLHPVPVWHVAAECTSSLDSDILGCDDPGWFNYYIPNHEFISIATLICECKWRIQDLKGFLTKTILHPICEDNTCCNDPIL